MEDDTGSSDLPDNEVLELLYESKKLCVQCARSVFERAISCFRTSAPKLKEERTMLLEEWLNMQSGFGKLDDICLVQARIPKKLKKEETIDD
ncbi:Crooked neck-like protein 1 [Ancistrocladus abbreviatus]